MPSEGIAAAYDAGSAHVSQRMSPKAAGVIFAATYGAFLSITPTVVALLGIFLKPIATEFGWPRSEVAGAISVVALGNAIAYPFAGRLADRIGPRRTILMGNALLGISILCLSLARKEPVSFYLLFLFAGAAGSMPSTMVISKLIAEWFDRTRGFWMGFCGGIGNGLGATAFPALAAAVLEAGYGWRTGFLTVGSIVLLTGFPILFFLLREAPIRSRTGPADSVVLEGMTFRQVMRSPMFWWIFSIVPLGAGCMTSMFTTIVPILTDRGIPLENATMVVVTFALTTLVVEPVVGFLTDRTSSPKLAAPLFFSAACGLWLLLHARSEPLLILSGMLMGVGAGVEYCILTYLLSRYFGLKELGAISGIAYSGTLVFGAIAPLFLHGVFDLLGSYDAAVYTIVGILIYSSVAILTFGKYRYAIHGRAG
jgi:MFS family permease